MQEPESEMEVLRCQGCGNQTDRLYEQDEKKVCYKCKGL